jgi:hypothetical protein
LMTLVLLPSNKTQFCIYFLNDSTSPFECLRTWQLN